MPTHRVLPKPPDQGVWSGQVPGPVPHAEEEPPTRQTINIDELSASPWVGLHYRHEFMLHHRHELLVQHLKD